MIKGIIFDCDGVLIDSEIIACRIAAEHMTKAGYEIDTMTFIQRFAGVRESDINAQIEADTGETNFMNRIDKVAKEKERIAAFKNELRVIDGVPETLKELVKKYPMAVASGSSQARLKHSLVDITKMAHFFEGHIYSAEIVANGKPAPDIFLHAAEQIGIDAEHCLVVGDSHHDVHGALAANMRVVGFAGASHGTVDLQHRLLDAGAPMVFENMQQLPELINQLETT